MNGANGQLLALIRQYDLMHDPDFGPIAMSAQAGQLSESMATVCLYQLQEWIENQHDHPDYLHRLPTPEQYRSDGSRLEIGHAVDDEQLRVGPRRDLVQDMLICGGKGSGKTTTLLTLIERIHQTDPTHSMIILDSKGSDFGHLAQKYGHPWQHISIHDPQTRIGFDAPPGVPPLLWCNVIPALFAARAHLIAAEPALMAMMKWLLRQLNTDADLQDPSKHLLWPDVSLLLELATSLPLTAFAAKPDYEKSLIQYLEAAARSTSVLHCFQGLNLERDIVAKGESVVLDMPGFEPTWLRRFVIDVLLAQLIYGRIQRKVKVDRPDVTIVWDEADPDVTAEADLDFPDRMSVLSKGLRWGRELGVRFIIAISRLGRASPFLLAEPAYHLIFRQSDSASMRAACETMVLPPGSDIMLPGLEPGECIYRESQSSWSHAMKVKVDYQPTRRELITRPFDRCPYIPAASIAKLPRVQHAVHELRRQLKADRLPKQRKEPTKQVETLDAKLHWLLHAAATHPFMPVARLWELEQPHPSPDQQNRIRRDIEAGRWAKFSKERLGRRNVLLMQITEMGWQLLNRKPPTHTGRGGLLHQHVAQWVAQVGRQRGHQVKTEFQFPGRSHPFDVAWLQSDGLYHLFEIAIDCFTNLESHLRAALQDRDKVAYITILITEKQHIATAEEAAGELQSLATFETIEPYMDEAHPSCKS